MFAICMKLGIIFKMRSTSFFHVSVPNIYGTSSSTYLIIFLKVISKVLFFNITQKFTNILVQLSIFLIDLFVGTYRLSSHARLEAFVIQTKLKLSQVWSTFAWLLFFSSFCPSATLGKNRLKMQSNFHHSILRVSAGYLIHRTCLQPHLLRLYFSEKSLLLNFIFLYNVGKP